MGNPINTIPANAIIEYSIHPSDLPDGLTFNTDTGLIAGTPSTAFSSRSYIVIATGRINYLATLKSNSFTISVKNTLQGTLSYTNTDTQVNENIVIRPTITIPTDAMLSFAISFGSLPDGLTLSSESGIISGSSNGAENITIQVSATAREKYTGTVASNIFNITVRAIGIDGSIRYQNVIEGVVDTYLSILPEIDITPPLLTLEFSQVTDLPEGLSINPLTGAIEGTPQSTSPGIFNRQAKVVETGIYSGEISSNEFKIRIYSEHIPIGGFIQYPSVIEGVLNTPLYILPVVEITPSDATVQFSKRSKLSTLPPGLSVNPVTGAIEGIPQERNSEMYLIDKQTIANGTGAYSGFVTSNGFKIKIY